jgi:hypothetical protein
VRATVAASFCRPVSTSKPARSAAMVAWSGSSTSVAAAASSSEPSVSASAKCPSASASRIESRRRSSFDCSGRTRDQFCRKVSRTALSSRFMAVIAAARDQYGSALLGESVTAARAAFSLATQSPSWLRSSIAASRQAVLKGNRVVLSVHTRRAASNSPRCARAYPFATHGLTHPASSAMR